MRQMSKRKSRKKRSRGHGNRLNTDSNTVERVTSARVKHDDAVYPKNTIESPEPIQDSFFGKLKTSVVCYTPDGAQSISALLFLRVIFFTLLAYDLWWIALSHAPRYGAAGFNVTHLSVLDTWAPIPTPSIIGALYICGGILSIIMALGLGGQLAIATLALFYNVSYLWSQADSYQHHYLLGLCLILFTGVPWREVRIARLNTHLKHWSLNVI